MFLYNPGSVDCLYQLRLCPCESDISNAQHSRLADATLTFPSRHLTSTCEQLQRRLADSTATNLVKERERPRTDEVLPGTKAHIATVLETISIKNLPVHPQVHFSNAIALVTAEQTVSYCRHLRRHESSGECHGQWP
jgi:hypothetical protein